MSPAAGICSGFRATATRRKDRCRINRLITEELNRRLGLSLTDAFCGFKAYRVAALAKIELTEPGYAMPLELWVRAVQLGLRIVELPVPLIYLDEKRSFGGGFMTPKLVWPPIAGCWNAQRKRIASWKNCAKSGMPMRDNLAMTSRPSIAI